MSDKSKWIKLADMRSTLEKMKENPNWSYHPDSTMRPFFFFFGRALTIFSCITFFIACLSDDWIHVIIGNTGSDTSMHVSFGPFVAKRAETQETGFLWEIIPGIDKISVISTQGVFSLAIFFYMTGQIVIVMQILLPKHLERYFCNINQQLLVEFMLAVGVLVAFLAMLMIGELKKRVLVSAVNTIYPSKYFIISIISLITTLMGLVSMALTRYHSSNSMAAKYIYRMRRWTRQRVRIKRGSQQKLSLAGTTSTTPVALLAAGDNPTKEQPKQENTPVLKPNIFLVGDTASNTGVASKSNMPGPEKV